MYINAAMQWYAVLRPSDEGISPSIMVQLDDKWDISIQEEGDIIAILSGVRECVWLV
jgi:hypothetical protein